MEAIAVVRDLSIILLAFESIVIGVGVLIVVWQTWRIVALARRYFETFGVSATNVLDSVQDTARTTQGTAGFVADRTAKPVIELYSAVAGASRFARALFSPRRSNDPNREGERDE